MLATIDAGGRIVVPKEIRERLGLTPGSRVELVEADGHLEISPATIPVTLASKDGVIIAIAESDIPQLTAEQVRTVIDSTRR